MADILKLSAKLIIHARQARCPISVIEEFSQELVKLMESKSVQTPAQRKAAQAVLISDIMRDIDEDTIAEAAALTGIGIEINEDDFDDEDDLAAGMAAAHKLGIH